MSAAVYRRWDAGGEVADYATLGDAACGEYLYKLDGDDPRRWWTYASEADADADEGAIGDIAEIRPDTEDYWHDTWGHRHPEPEVAPKAAPALLEALEGAETALRNVCILIERGELVHAEHVREQRLPLSRLAETDREIAAAARAAIALARKEQP